MHTAWRETTTSCFTKIYELPKDSDIKKTGGWPRAAPIASLWQALAGV